MTILDLNKDEQNLYNYYLNKTSNGVYRTSISNLSHDLELCPTIVTLTLESLFRKNIIDYAETDFEIYLVRTNVSDRPLYLAKE